MIKLFKDKVMKYEFPYYMTQGISSDIGYEVRIKKGEYSDEDYLYILKYIIDYIVKESPALGDEQSISFNSWILKFKLSKEGFLDINELDEFEDTFVEGSEFAISLMKSQIEICEKYSSKFIFPIVNQKVVISDGVFDDYPVEAVRYKSPKHMSGWWITTDLYNDDINSLKQVDLSELILKRKDLIRYLALDSLKVKMVMMFGLTPLFPSVRYRQFATGGAKSEFERLIGFKVVIKQI